MILYGILCGTSSPLTVKVMREGMRIVLATSTHSWISTRVIGMTASKIDPASRFARVSSRVSSGWKRTVPVVVVILASRGNERPCFSPMLKRPALVGSLRFLV